MVQDIKEQSINQANENLAKPMEDIKGVVNGRGIGKFELIGSSCICNRPYSHIMCQNCGHLMFGRVRYGCPIHKMVTFLIDITNCPKCRAFEYMLEEFEAEDCEIENDFEEGRDEDDDGKEDEDL